jgi:hypothetical protein
MVISEPTISFSFFLKPQFPPVNYRKVGQRKTIKYAMFVSRNSLFGKPLSKLSCVCLPLEKLFNEKHFSVKGKFGLVFRKVFSWKIWAENIFWKL